MVKQLLEQLVENARIVFSHSHSEMKPLVLVMFSAFQTISATILSPLRPRRLTLPVFSVDLEPTSLILRCKIWPFLMLFSL